MFTRRIISSTIAVIAGFLVATAARAESLDQALLKQAPELLKLLRERDVKNVGVLKFRVNKGRTDATDNAGLFNINAARRLEIALILANDKKNPIGIVKDASTVAATIDKANHLTAEGRKPFFTKKYPLAWGTDRVEPDAFLTGRVEISEDLKEMTVLLFVFDSKSDKIERVAKFTADMNPATLVETGESFVVRGLLPADGDQVIEAAAGAQKAPPAKDPAAPISLQVLFNGKQQPFEVKDGKALLKEPTVKDAVTLRLVRNDKSQDTFGVALMVNGENTLFRQKGNPLQCRKWVIGPEDQAVDVTGYHVTEDILEKFQVLSRADSDPSKINYTEATGTITMTVFRQRKDGPGAPPPPPKTDAEANVKAVEKGQLPTNPADTLEDLQGQLRSAVKPKEKKEPELEVRGLISGGEKVKGKALPRVPFSPDPTPVMSMTIRYFKP